MAEINRKSGRRLLETINTKKSTKSEVYDFYKRFRKQLQGRGIKSKLLSYNVKKSDIVKELESFEKQELENSLMTQYNRLISKVSTIGAKKVVVATTKFENRLKMLDKSGMIDLKTFNGGSFLSEMTRTMMENDIPYTDESQVKKFKGKYAQDMVREWIDQGLLDPETYEESDKIFTDMESVRKNNEKFKMFEEIYEGKATLHSSKYYEDFEEFLKDFKKFENTLADITNMPEFGTKEYNKLYIDWKKSLKKL